MEREQCQSRRQREHGPRSPCKGKEIQMRVAVTNVWPLRDGMTDGCIIKHCDDGKSGRSRDDMMRLCSSKSR
jgi:hypothetical protein